MKNGSASSSLQVKPYALESEAGRKFECSEALVLVKASTEQTSGAFNVLEITAPAGFATSLHIHYAEDVALYVLEGTLTVYWGDQKRDAAAGSYFFQPRGTPYGFRVTGSAPARILSLAVPAGFDQFIQESSLPAKECDPTTTAARYKIEILGPLPE